MKSLRTIPQFVSRYFWGDKIDNLSLEKNINYIAQTLLEKGDKQAVSWLLQSISIDDAKKLLPTLILSPKSKNYWQLMLK